MNTRNKILQHSSFQSGVIHAPCYLLGLFDKSKSILKQQNRALNLCYALEEKKYSNIAIIGGGIGGMTCAMALHALGKKVHVFEKEADLCHLQAGCQTRWIHPNIYDWPNPGSSSPWARTPFLNWKAGTAADIVAQMRKQWDEVCLADKNIQNFQIFLDSNVRFSQNKLIWQGRSYSNGERKRKTERFDTYIFAIGFGLERIFESLPLTSYWRNDSLNQLDLTRRARSRKEILISGAGDGGLIDLFRTTIKDFKQDSIIEELEMDKPKVLKILRKLNSAPSELSKALYDKEEQFKSIREKLQKRLRNDTHAILNAEEPSIDKIVDNGRASFLNAFLLHQLYSISTWSFEYFPGNLISGTKSQDGIEITFKGRAIACRFDEVIIRHGTKVADTLKIAEIPDQDVTNHEKYSCRAESKFDIPQWPAGWWSSNCIENARVFNTEITKEKKYKIEFVSPAISRLASTFVATLVHSLQLEDTEKEFRATVHRVIYHNQEHYYQQICEYFGFPGKVIKKSNNKPNGRIFTINSGMVGLSINTGKICIAEGKDFTKSQNNLNTDKNTCKIRKAVKSILAVPFVGSKNGKRTVIAVLFIDSNLGDFFNEDVIKKVVAQCQAFKNNIERAGFNLKFHELEGPTLKFEDQDPPHESIKFWPLQESKPNIKFKKISNFNASA